MLNLTRILPWRFNMMGALLARLTAFCVTALCAGSACYSAGESVMKPENRYLTAIPKLLPADRESTVTIRPLYDHVRFQDGDEFEVTCVATDGSDDVERLRVRASEGVLRITHRFAGEQEHALVVERVVGEDRRLQGDYRVYSLREDLLSRLPYKGDLHMHSYYSDGVESPAYVAAACRRIGLDFMALTDHRQYSPSLEAQQVFEDAAVELRIFPGEEVHPPDNPTHIVNFGGRFSINDLFAGSSYLQEVEAIAAELPKLPAGVDRTQYASAVWTFGKIREAGGLGVLCHPDWFSDYRYRLPQPLAAYILEQQPFDAYELLGGYSRAEAFSNNRQVARYVDARSRGHRLPIVGASDAHGCETGSLFGWYYTVVFSPSLELADLIGSIKGEWSVAVEALPGEVVRVYGPLRLVRYTLFLLREVFPQHDLLCAEEGQLMLDYIAGRPGAEQALQLRQGRVAQLYREYRAK